MIVSRRSRARTGVSLPLVRTRGISCPSDGNGSSDIFSIDRGAAIPDLSIYATGETNLQGLGLHGINIMQRRELPLTNSLATFFFRLDNDGPTNETYSVRANLSPAGWSAQFFRNTTNISA